MNTLPRLGLNPSPHDPRTLVLASYLDAAALPPPPAERDWAGRVSDWKMLLNDQVGNCAIDEKLHTLMAMTSWTKGAPADFTDRDSLKAYEDVSGYVPGRPETDVGCNMLAVNKYFQKTGVAGHTILGYARVNLKDHAQVKAAINLFGGVAVGADLPLAAQDGPWSDPPNLRGRNAPGSWGGHAIPLLRYTAAGLTCVTWGALKDLSWGWLDAYAFEGWVVLTQDWLDALGKTPSGFDLDALRADIKALGGDPGPAPTPPAPTPPPPPAPAGYALGQGAVWNLTGKTVVIAVRFRKDDGTEFSHSISLPHPPAGAYHTDVFAVSRP